MWADQEFGLHLTEKGYGNTIGIGKGGGGAPMGNEVTKSDHPHGPTCSYSNFHSLWRCFLYNSQSKNGMR